MVLFIGAGCVEAPDLAKDSGLSGEGYLMVTLGSGEDAFVSLEEKHALPIFRGSQGGGGFHVYAACRLEDRFEVVDAVSIYALDSEGAMVAGNLTERTLDSLAQQSVCDSEGLGRDCVYYGQEVRFYFAIPYGAQAGDFQAEDNPFLVEYTLCVQLDEGTLFEGQFSL
jgi:hypothetical protein